MIFIPAQTPIPIGPIKTPLPLPTADIPAMPPIVKALWWEAFGRPFLYTPDQGPPPTPTPTSEWLGTFMSSVEEVVPPDFPLQIRDALPGLKTSIGVAEWQIKYFANAPFEFVMHYLLAFSVGFLAYCSTWIILSNAALPWAERRSGGRFQAAEAAFSTSLLCISVAVCAALFSHLWWDGLFL